LGLDARESEVLTAAAAATDAVTGVCFVYRHFPLVQELRARLRGGGDGPVHLVRASYLQDWLLRRDDWNWRLDAAHAGASRAVADIGSHAIDLIQHVTGEPIVAVAAQIGRVHDTRISPGEEGRETFAVGGSAGTVVAAETEDHAGVLFRLASGAHGVLSVSQVSAGRKNHLGLEVDVANAGYSWDQEEPNHLWIGRRDGANADVLRDPANLSPAARPLAHLPGGHQEGWPDALRNLFDDFYASVLAARLGTGDREATFATFADATRVQAVVEAVLRSDSTRSWADVDVEREEATT
jgi:predicted dehydrogenase